MERIAEIVPVVPVPLLAMVMQDRDEIQSDDLPALMQTQLDQMKSAHVHMPRGEIGYAAEIALKHLSERRVLRIEGDRIIADEAQRGALQYYANSIAHLQQ